jgi:TolB-like protein
MPGTEAIFTTRKLQALLDSRMSPEVHNRAKLAETMTARGQPISVHGVDAWFKHTDSNYAIERESLDPHHPSYTLPKGRWETLFEIFALPPESIDRDDAEFRRWCFGEARNRRQKPTPLPARGGRIACCYDPRDVDFVAEDRPWYASERFDVIEVSTQSNHSDWSVARALKDADGVVVYTSQNFSSWPLVHELKQALAQHPVPSLTVACDGFKDSMLGLERYSRRTGDHRAAITAMLRDRPPGADAAMPRRGPSWQPPALYTARPSIAVLPFANFVGRSEFDELAEALAEDITSMLSRVPELFVVSASTTRTYRSEMPDSRVVRDELGVRYVLEGSIRRGSGSGVWVTAQLVDAVQRNGLWAHRFEREAEDLVIVQDELAVAICAQLEPRIRLSDIQLGASLKSTPAWRMWQEGWYWLFVDAPQPRPERSLKLFRDALALEPDYPLAHAGLSIALSTSLLWGGAGPEAMVDARLHAEKASKLLPGNATVMYALGMLSFVAGDSLETVIDYVGAAVDQEPSNAMYHGVLGYLLSHVGRTREGLDRCLYAMRLSPRDSREPFLCYMLGNAFIAAGEYQRGIESFNRCLRFSEVDFVWVMLGYGHHCLGDLNRARDCLLRIEKPRSRSFYEWSLRNRLWLSHPDELKLPFIPFLTEHLFRHIS